MHEQACSAVGVTSVPGAGGPRAGKHEHAVGACLELQESASPATRSMPTRAAQPLPVAFRQVGRSLILFHHDMTCGNFAKMSFAGVAMAYST
jgi:hypothetical protein